MPITLDRFISLRKSKAQAWKRFNLLTLLLKLSTSTTAKIVERLKLIFTWRVNHFAINHGRTPSWDGRVFISRHVSLHKPWLFFAPSLKE